MSAGEVSLLSEEYDYYTEQSSNGLRAYAFAVIAASWLFLSGGSQDPAEAISTIRVEAWLAASIVLSVGALAADSAQYLFAAIYIQRRQRVLDFMLRPGPWPAVTYDDQIMWGRALKYRMLTLGVELAGKNTDELRSGPASKYVDVWRSIVLAGPVSEVAQAMSRRVPKGLVSGTRRLFLLKAILAGGSLASLTLYLVIKLISL